jgi:hypothetical protein
MPGRGRIELTLRSYWLNMDERNGKYAALVSSKFAQAAGRFADEILQEICKSSSDDTYPEQCLGDSLGREAGHDP